MSPILISFLGLLLLLALLAFGLSIGGALMISGFLGLFLLGTWEQAYTVFVSHSYNIVNNYTLIALACFMVMGHWAMYSGMTTKLYDAAYAWLARFPGGLALATTLGCAAFAATTGSAMATEATMARIAIPEMERVGYHPTLSTGVVAASGTLAILIPPSGIAVLYAWLTGESVSKMVIAGLLPGIVSALLYMIQIYLRVKRNPALAPGTVSVSWKERFARLADMWTVAILMIIVVGGIYSGLTTVVEASAAGAIAALVLALATRSLSFADFKKSMSDSAELIAMIFFIIIGAAVFTLFIAMSGLPYQINEFLLSLPYPPYVVMIFILIFYIPMGMFMDAIAVCLLTIPILYPIVLALGFDGIWFGVMVIKMTELAAITPPIGVGCYVVKAAAPSHISLNDVFVGIFPFAITDLITVAILFIFPQITLWLPSTM